MSFRVLEFDYENKYDELQIINDKNTPIYLYKNLKIGNLNGEEITLTGEYILVGKMNQYFHFLKEYFGGYLYYKNNINPKVKFLFISDNSVEYNLVDVVINETIDYLKNNDGIFIDKIDLENSYLNIENLVIIFDHGRCLTNYNKFFDHFGMPDFIKELRFFYSKFMIDDDSIHKKNYITRRAISEGQERNRITGKRLFRYYDKHMEDALENFFSDLGYEIVETIGMTMQEQVKLFYNSTHIAGALGTNFLNGIFCKPGTKFISVNRNPKYTYNFEGEIKSVIDCEFYYHQLEEHVGYERFKESLNRIINKEIC